jgi:hypothetical protein
VTHPKSITVAVTLTTLTPLFLVAPVAAQSELGRIEIGLPFPDEKFPALADGRPTSLAQFRGKRILLLVFASW